MANFAAHAHTFHWVCANSCLCRKHETVGAVNYCVECVGRFCARWNGPLDHRHEHLVRYYHGLAGEIALVHNLLLHKRNRLNWHLHAKIAAHKHQAIRNLEDLVNPFESLLIFDLCNDLDARITKHHSDLHHIRCRPHVRLSNKVDATVQGKSNVLRILLADGRQCKISHGNINALVLM
eukprot:Opistho-2@67559